MTDPLRTPPLPDVGVPALPSLPDMSFLDAARADVGFVGQERPGRQTRAPRTISPAFDTIRDHGSFLFDDVIVEAFKDQFLGVFVGIGERMGMAPEGSRQKLRDDFLAAKELFTATVDPETGEERSRANVVGRKAATLTAQLAANLLPLAPGFAAGNLVAKILHTGAKGTVLLRGAIAGASEAGLVAMGDAPLMEKENRGRALAFGLGAGAALGAAGGALALRTARSARRAAGRGNSAYRDGAIVDSELIEGRSVSEVMRDLNQRFYDNAFNEHEPLTRIFRKTRGPVEGPRAAEEINQVLRGSRRTATNSIVGRPQIFNMETRDWEDVLRTADDGTTFVQEGLENVLARYTDTVPIEDLDAALVAVRNEELMAREAYGRQMSLPFVDADNKAIRFTSKEAQWSLQLKRELNEKYEHTLDDSGFTILDRFVDDFSDWSRTQVEQLRAVDMLTDKDVQNILYIRRADGVLVPRKWAKYTRLAKALGAELKESPKRAATGELFGVKRLASPDHKILSPIRESAMASIAISRAVDRQIWARALKDEALRLGADSPILIGSKRLGRLNVDPRRVAKQRRLQVSSEDITRLQKELRIPEDDTVTPLFRAMEQQAGEGRILHYQDGVKEYLEAPVDLLRASGQLVPEQSGVILRSAGLFTKTLRAGATLFAPAFFVRNLIRDQFTAFVNSAHGFIPFVDPIRFVFHELWTRAAGKVVTGEFRPSQFWDEAVRSGAIGAAFVGSDRAGIDATLRTVKNLGVPGTFKKFLAETASNPLYPLQVASEGIEKATRFSEFRLSRLGGRRTVGGIPVGPTRVSGRAFLAAPDEAARQALGAGTRLAATLDAAEVSLNFSRAGTVGRNWNQLEAFINAELQDFDKFIRNLRNPSKRFSTTVKGLAGITMPTLAHWAMWRGDEDYEARPEWEKQLFFHLSKRPDGTFLKVPRPIGALNIFFGMAPETVARFAYDQDPEAGKRFVETLTDQSPIGMVIDPQRAARSLIPTFAEPALENLFNYDLFFESSIVPKRLQDELPELQFTESTPELAKMVGRGLRASPLKVQNLIEGYLGTIGRIGSRVVDQAVIGKEPLADPRDRENAILGEGIPIAGPFVSSVRQAFVTGRSPYGFDAQPVRDFYALLEEANIGRNVLAAQTTAQGRRLALSRHPQGLIADHVNRTSRSLSELSRMRRTVMESDQPELVKAEQLLKIDQIVATTAASMMSAYARAIVSIKYRVDTGTLLGE